MSEPDELRAKIDAIRGNKALIRPPRPVAPVFTTSEPIIKRLNAIQKYIYAFEYNHTNQNFFNVNKERPYGVIMAASREITRECLPIKCMEAVMLALLLTNSVPSHQLLRVPLRFKSKLDGHTFRHIVLAVRVDNKWGALGLSRKSTLEFKRVEYPSLSALINEYRREYELLHHSLRAVCLGLPITLDEHSNEHVYWTCLVCPVWSESDWTRCGLVVETFIKEGERNLEFVRCGLEPRPVQHTVLLDAAASVGTGEGLGRRLCMISPSHPKFHERLNERALKKAAQLDAHKRKPKELSSPTNASKTSRNALGV